MGLLEKMFGSKKDYPALDPASPEAGQIERMQGSLGELYGRAHKPLEVLPGEAESYIFIGHPPKDFGIAWIEGDRIMTFKALAEERGLDPKKFSPLAERLRQIYEANREDPRYTAIIGGQKIVVTPSEDFRRQVAEVIREATH
jgi:hypothetical protein